MKHPLVVSLFLLSPLSSFGLTELNSREYKTLLQLQPFRNNITTALSQLEHELSRIGAGAGATNANGSFTLKKGTPRWVLYYDTPGDCQLARHQWTLRLRKEKQQTQQQQEQEPWEATLKTRCGDRYHSSYRGEALVKGCLQGDKGKHKFEEDIAHLDWTGSVFSFSQKCYLDGSGSRNNNDNNIADAIRQIDSLRFIGDTWGNMEEYIRDELKRDATTPLALVGNTTITEVAYDGFSIDLEKGKKSQLAQAKVSLWYDDSNTLIVAELSMRIQSKHEDWSEKTIFTMHEFWEECASSLEEKWLDLNSKTKTQWVYEWDPSFCNTEDPDDEDT